MTDQIAFNLIEQCYQAATRTFGGGDELKAVLTKQRDQDQHCRNISLLLHYRGKMQTPTMRDTAWRYINNLLQQITDPKLRAAAKREIRQAADPAPKGA